MLFISSFLALCVVCLSGKKIMENLQIGAVKDGSLFSVVVDTEIEKPSDWTIIKI